MAVKRFRVGDVVRCERGTPARGTWKNYAGKVGVVVVANNYGEVGVSFTSPGTPIADRRADSWFLPSELVLAEMPAGAVAALFSPSDAQVGP